MKTGTQEPLLDLPEQPTPKRPASPKAGQRPDPPKLKPIDRSQGFLRPVIVNQLVGPDHKVRAIWDLTGQWDLSEMLEKVHSLQGRAGRAAWNPRLLLSIWLYAYSEQVTSAREIERMMEYEPGLMWLAGLGEVNHHTLSDFRADHQEELKKLLADLLGLLSKEGFVKLELVAHDGTKIRAQAGADTFRRETTLEKEITKARQMVEELDQQAADSEQQPNARRQKAQERAARERLERLQQASKELEQIRKNKKNEQERQQARVSLTEPEARPMKHGDNAIAPSYNMQISTDAENKIIVGVHLTQCSSDSGSLLPAMEQVKATTGQFPKKVVVDGGFTNQASMAQMKANKIDLYGAVSEPGVRHAAALKRNGIDPGFGAEQFKIIQEKKTLQCPAGKVLTYAGQSGKHGQTYHQYQAEANDCRGCAFQKQCCPNVDKGRLVSVQITGNAEVAEFREKMKTEPAKQIYRQRGAVAEFPNCWIKEKLGIRKFRLRGLVKATTEALWGVLTYDVLQWLRLSWMPKRMAAMAV